MRTYKSFLVVDFALCLLGLHPHSAAAATAAAAGELADGRFKKRKRLEKRHFF